MIDRNTSSKAERDNAIFHHPMEFSDKKIVKHDSTVLVCLIKYSSPFLAERKKEKCGEKF